MTDEHTHKWFLFQVKADFEPVEYGKTGTEILYRRIEYAFMSCNCGSSLKTKVKNGDTI